MGEIRALEPSNAIKGCPNGHLLIDAAYNDARTRGRRLLNMGICALQQSLRRDADHRTALARNCAVSATYRSATEVLLRADSMINSGRSCNPMLTRMRACKNRGYKGRLAFSGMRITETLTIIMTNGNAIYADQLVGKGCGLASRVCSGQQNNLLGKLKL